MTNPDKFAGKSALEVFLEIGKDFQKQQQAEAARIDALPPAERERLAKLKSEREAQAAVKRQAQIRQALFAKVKKAAAAYKSHSSFTIHVFACLLEAINPDDYTEWVVYPDDSVERVKRTAKVLMSAVRSVPEPIDGVLLYPVNPHDSSEKWRFQKRPLMAFSAQTKLGFWEALAAAIEIDPALPVESPTRSPSKPAIEPRPTVQEALKPSSQKEREWKATARKVVETLIERAQTLSLDINAQELPVTWDDLYELFKTECQGKAPVELATFRKVVKKFGYGCVPGNRGPEAIAVRKAILDASRRV